MPQGPDSRLSVRPPLEPARTADAPESAVSDIVAGIARDSKRIVAGYLDLAKLDVRQELADAGRALAYAAIAVATGVTGLVLVLAAVARGLTWGTGLPLGASYAIVGGVTGVVAVVMSRMARRALKVPEAVEEAKEDLAWIKDNV